MSGGEEESGFWAEGAPLLSVGGGMGMQGPGSEQKGKAGQQERCRC